MNTEVVKRRRGERGTGKKDDKLFCHKVLFTITKEDKFVLDCFCKISRNTRSGIFRKFIACLMEADVDENFDFSDFSFEIKIFPRCEERRAEGAQ